MKRPKVEPGTYASTDYYFDCKREQVRGYHSVRRGNDTGRIRSKLATFAELSLDDRGKLTRGGDQAEKRLAHTLEGLHRERQLLAGEEEKAKRGQSVRVLWQEYLDTQRPDHAPSTIDLLLQTGSRWIEAVGDCPVSSINERHRSKFIAFLDGKGLSPASINKHLRCIRSFLHWAKDCGELAEVPRFKQIGEPKKIPRVLDEKDFQRLLEHIERKIVEARTPRERRFLLLHQRFAMIAAGTGARRNEIVMCPWANVNFTDGVMVVRVSTRLRIKEKREKAIPLAGFLLAYLKAQRAESPQEKWIMDDGRGNLAYKDGHAVTTAFSRHLADLGLSDVKSTHFFRAQFATRMRHLGTDVWTIAGLLGHSSPTVTERYFSGEEELKKRAIEGLDKLAQGWHKPSASLPSP